MARQAMSEAQLQIPESVDINALAKVADIAEIEAAVLGTQVAEPDPPDQPEERAESERPSEDTAGQDSKTMLPYGVVKQLRKDHRAALAENAELKAELERIKAGQQEQPSTTEPTPDIMSAEQLAVLEEDFPEHAAAFKATLTEQAQLKRELAELKQLVVPLKSLQAERVQSQQSDIDAAIDQVPLTRYLVDTARTDPQAAALLNEAIEIEQAIRKLPKYRNEPVASAKVFAAVAKELQEAHEITIPAEYLSPKDLQAKAEKAARNPKPQRFESLGDLPGGVPPGKDGIDIEGASAVSLGVAFQRMSRAEQDAYLSRFG